MRSWMTAILMQKGKRNYWGYNTIGFFAPQTRYLSGPFVNEFKEMVSQFHRAGIEIILDVVYNHTAEGNELGPTLSFKGIDNASYYRLAPDRRYYINDTGTGNTVNLSHQRVLQLVADSCDIGRKRCASTDSVLIWQRFLRGNRPVSTKAVGFLMHAVRILS